MSLSLCANRHAHPTRGWITQGMKGSSPAGMPRTNTMKGMGALAGERRNERYERLTCRATPDKNGASSSSSSFVETMINGLTVAIQSSPLAEGKKQLAVLQAGEYDENAVKERMERYISENTVMMFSFSTCPFCKNAKKVLDDMNVSYEAVELNEMDGGMAIRAELAKKTGRTSMPNIWIGGKGIGGCNDGPGILTLQKNGQLVPMLKEAGAL